MTASNISSQEETLALLPSPSLPATLVATLQVGANGLGLGVGGAFRVTRRSRARIVGVLQPLSSLADTFTFLPLTSVQQAFGTGDPLSFAALRLERQRQLQVSTQHLPR